MKIETVNLKTLTDVTRNTTTVHCGKYAISL